jgi:hypothetical protein
LVAVFHGLDAAGEGLGHGLQLAATCSQIITAWLRLDPPKQLQLVPPAEVAAGLLCVPAHEVMLAAHEAFEGGHASRFGLEGFHVGVVVVGQDAQRTYCLRLD